MLPDTLYIKDRLLTVRSALPEDAAAWLRYLCQVGDETDFLAFSSQQVNISTQEAQQYLQHISGSSANLLLLALDNLRVVACLNLQRGHWPFNHHQAEFGISVLAEFWGYGLARHMMEIMLEWAAQHHIRKINLKVRTDNIRAIQLYQSMGFNIEGTINRECFRPGVYYSAYQMSLKL